jgi:hypothetical protein
MWQLDLMVYCLQPAVPAVPAVPRHSGCRKFRRSSVIGGWVSTYDSGAYDSVDAGKRKPHLSTVPALFSILKPNLMGIRSWCATAA